MEVSDSKLTPEEAFEYCNKGIWVTCNGYTYRNTNKCGQYLTYGSYPDSIRECSKHNLNEMHGRVVPGTYWKIATLNKLEDGGNYDTKNDRAEDTADNYSGRGTSAGVEHDAGEPRFSMVLGNFSRALVEVAEVGIHGAAEYSDNGWLQVPFGIARFSDAHWRHLLEKGKGNFTDHDSGLSHSAYIAWNALAVLELELIAKEKEREAWENTLV